MDAGDSEGHARGARRVGDDLNRLRGEALFAHSRNAVVDIDLAGVIMAFNPAAERLFGRHARDVVGGPVGVLLPDRSAEEIGEQLAELAGRRDVEPCTTNFRRPEGEMLELSVTAVPLVRSDGSRAGFTVLLEDLTPLRRSQAALVVSEARYRTMIESAHEGIVVVDGEDRLTFVNARFAEMFGYDVEEMTGLSLGAITFPENECGVAGMRKRRREGLSEVSENRWPRKDGSTLWTIMASAPLFEEAGAFAGSVSFHTDVTDRKRAEAALRESEARLRSYFEYAPVGLVLVDREGLVVNVNPALCLITGYERGELLGGGLSFLLGPDHQARVGEIRVLVGALLSGEMPSFEFEQPFVAKGGLSILLEVTVSVMRDAQGEPLEFVAVVQDVTARKDAERVKDEFVSVTSHELRTPLTSIRGALGLLAGGVVGDLPDSAQRMLDVAIQSTDRLIRLINDILDLERLTSGKLSLSLEACDAAGLISRAVEEIRGAADEVEVEVRAGSVNGRVWADPDRILQTLTNVVGNAIKFSPRSATVEVSAQVEGDHVRFTVEDHGPGIPADQLERVFERFRQVDSSDSRTKGGTGLGLAICRTIVEQHGGRIWAESVLGAGTVFSFTLPVVADIEEENPEDRLCEPGVLVCDDDAAIREVVKTMLEASGYQVWTAASGEEALAVAQARHPDVIVLDLLLPGIDGRETAHALKGRAETADIPVVVLSVLTAEQMEVEGAASRVEKPIEEDVLLTALRHALGGDHRQALVVEDDPQLAEVLEVTLARHGLKVRRARTGREAMRLGRALVPDLLVLDLALPGGDGYSVVEWMRSQRWLSSVPVLVYTAFDLEKADRNRLRLGETKFLTKGRTSPALFEAKLEELLDWMAQEVPRR
ncbi:MAG: PAS domain S-box protein [Acidimicrobiales bacterium]